MIICITHLEKEAHSLELPFKIPFIYCLILPDKYILSF